jgi:hypothetical protein
MKYIIEFELDIDKDVDIIDSQCDLEHVAISKLTTTLDNAINIDDLYDKTKFDIYKRDPLGSR